MTLSRSTKTFFILVTIHACLSAIYIFVPQISGLPLDTSTLPASPILIALAVFGIVMLVYGGFGYIGLFLTRRVGWPDLWEPTVSNKQRFWLPVKWGALIGLIIVISDFVVGHFTDAGNFPHPGFPGSILASYSAGVGEEAIFRLFFITFWFWLLSKVIFKKINANLIFWIVATLSALSFAAGHLPSFMTLTGATSISQIPPITMIEIFVLNSVLSFPAAYYFRKYGILVAMGIHFWADIVWHVIYPLF